MTNLLSALVVVLCVASPAFSQSVLRAEPAVITRCTVGERGRTKLFWDSGGVAPVQIRVDRSSGPAMTGMVGATGSAETGDWVGDGLGFFLVDGAGFVLAEARVAVACGQGPPLPGPETLESYFPLQTGNRWTFELASRSVARDFETWSVVGEEQDAGVRYFRVSTGDGIVRYRTDEQGRVFRSDGGGPERLWLDTGQVGGEEAELRTVSVGGGHTAPAGVFEDVVVAMEYESLFQTTWVFARGVGPVSVETILLAGSSGGFLKGLELTRARIGAIELAAPETSLALAIEKPVVRLVPGEVANCVLPCYFVACGLVPPVEDPPGTFKPCMRVRVALRGMAGRPVSFELELKDGLGEVVQRVSGNDVELGEDFPEDGEESLTRFVPLYTAPNEPVPVGTYTVAARAVVEGTYSYQASVPLIVE